MISIDSNVLVSVWQGETQTREQIATALNTSRAQESLVVCGMVYAELMASRTVEFALDRVLDAMLVDIDWTMDEAIFRAAGEAYSLYGQRRWKRNRETPRRILTDFLIGAHAMVNGHSLLTLDRRHYRAAFPALKLVTV